MSGDVFNRTGDITHEIILNGLPSVSSFLWYLAVIINAQELCKAFGFSCEEKRKTLRLNGSLKNSFITNNLFRVRSLQFTVDS